MPGTPCGKPIACIVGSTSVRSFLAPRICGQTLSGGSIPFVTQSRSATRIRFVSSVEGTGLTGIVPVPQLFPGQFAPVVEGISFIAPLLPPCVELGR